MEGELLKYKRSQLEDHRDTQILAVEGAWSFKNIPALHSRRKYIIQVTQSNMIDQIEHFQFQVYLHWQDILT